MPKPRRRGTNQLLNDPTPLTRLDPNRELHVEFAAKTARQIVQALQATTRCGQEKVLLSLLELERKRHRRELDEEERELDGRAGLVTLQNGHRVSVVRVDDTVVELVAGADFVNGEELGRSARVQFGTDQVDVVADLGAQLQVVAGGRVWGTWSELVVGGCPEERLQLRGDGSIAED